MKTSYRVLITTQLRAILGRRYGNLVMIGLIFTLSLLAIGLGNGGRIYLREKMDSPFVRFVNVTIPFGYGDPRGYWADLTADRTRTRFHISGVTAVHTGYAGFADASGKLRDALVSDTHEGDALYEFLTSDLEILLSDPSENRLFSAMGANGWGCIVTQAYLKKIGLPLDAPYLHFNFPGTSAQQRVPIPVCGVVQQLPNFIDMLVSEKLLQAINQKYEPPNPLDITAAEHQDYLRVFVPITPEEEGDYAERFKALGYHQEQSASHVEGVIMEKLGIQDAAMEQKLLQNEFPGKQLEQVYEYGRVAIQGQPGQLTTEYITIAFDRLDSVRAFQSYLAEQHQLKIDMRDIEAADNFRLLQSLIGGLSILLMGFSGIAVILFVSNVVTSYLDKQRRSLGTLKAFGLSDAFIIRLYSGISIALILSGFLVGLIFSYPIGCVVASLLELGSAGDQMDFIQWPIYWLVLGFVILPAGLIAGILYIRLRGRSPGDLVYERE